MIRVLAHLDRESATAHRLGDDPGSLALGRCLARWYAALEGNVCDLY